MENTTPRNETFAKADGMAGERSICFGTNRNNKYVIRIDWPAGEDIGPDFYRYDSADEALAMWDRVVAEWKAAGYIPAEEYWAALRADLAEVK